MKIKPKRLFKPSKEFQLEVTGEQWATLREPIIYAWYRYEDCLYVGQSEHGFSRVLRRHHVINVLDKVQPHDHFRFYLVKPLKGQTLNEALDLQEQSLIKRLCPTFNEAHNPRAQLRRDYEKTLHRSPNMPTMRPSIPPKKSVAKILFDPMSFPDFLGDSHDNQNTTTLSREDKLKQLADIRHERDLWEQHMTNVAKKQSTPKEFTPGPSEWREPNVS